MEAYSSEIAELCRDTPGVLVLDNLGSVVRSVAYQRTQAGEARQTRISRRVHDTLGRVTSLSDPRFFARQANEPGTPGNERYRYAASGRVLTRESRDAGWRVNLVNASGAVLLAFDQRQQRWRWDYDPLGRVAAVHVAAAGQAERCAERLSYGDTAGDASAARAANLRGRLVRHFDQAGLMEARGYGLGGQVLTEQRRFLSQASWESDWPQDAGAAEAHLDAETYTSRWHHDALGDELQLLDAAGHRRRSTYFVSGRPAEHWVRLEGGTEQIVVTGLRYSPEHQRLSERTGNQVRIDHTYEPRSRRLSRSTATRLGDAAVLQDFTFTYDPAGNIVAQDNAAEATRYYRNQKVTARRTYTYDTLYQLLSASGREHAGAAAESGRPTPPASNAMALVNYTRRFDYDDAGNLTATHHSGAQHYVQAMAVSSESNRAVMAANGGDVDAQFDAHGNQRELHSGQALAWSIDDRLRQAIQIDRADEEDDTECYGYGGDGLRVRKWRQWRSANLTHRAEVRYLPGIELRSNSASGEQLVVVIASGASQAPLRVLHWRAGRPPEIANDQFRYQLNDHLGSTTLELDASAQLISAEEYYPYGGTALWTARNEVEADYKTVRYSGKERDITGLYDYGLRHYAPWLARWIHPDPAGLVDGLNLYAMVGNNPIVHFDANGAGAVDTIAHAYNDMKTVKQSAKQASSVLQFGTTRLVVQGSVNVAAGWAAAPVASAISLTPLRVVPIVGTLAGSLLKEVQQDINPKLVKAKDIQDWEGYVEDDLAIDVMDTARRYVPKIAKAAAKSAYRASPIKTSGIQSAIEKTNKVWRRTEGLQPEALQKMYDEIPKLEEQIDKLTRKALAAFDEVESWEGKGAAVTPLGALSALRDEGFTSSIKALWNFRELLTARHTKGRFVALNNVSITRTDILRGSVKAKKHLYDLQVVLKEMLYPAIGLRNRSAMQTYTRQGSQLDTAKHAAWMGKLQDIPFMD